MTGASRHIPFAQLVDLVERRLSPDEQAERQAHVSGCSHCTAEAAWLERVIGLMRGNDAEDPPADVVKQVIALFGSRAIAPPPSPRRRIIAWLSFDSAQFPLARGVRSGIFANRQLLFNAQGFDLDLRITPTGSMWTVSGQVLGTDAGGQVELEGPTTTMQAALNGMCEFTLPPVLAGNYILTIRLREVDIEVASLQIG
jgi:hypothetical protein